MMLFHVSLTVVLEMVEDLRARFAAGAAAASPLGKADVPHRKHKTGKPFLSLSR